MKIGISSYSLSRAIAAGKFDILGAIDYIASIGGEHMEIVPSGSFSIASPDDPLIGQIKERAAKAGIELSGYTIAANLLTSPDGKVASPEHLKAEVERLKTQVRIAAAFGVRFMRHDAAWRSIEDCSPENFEQDMIFVAEGCRQIADFAKQFGITTSIENHGYHFQGSERVHRLVNYVNRDNFRTTMDVGNFTCADENSVVAVMNNINIASFIHFKDFYIREKVADTNGFFPSLHGRWLRGAITGHGDLDLFSVAKVIKNSGYDGYISIEYEGMEDCIDAVKLSLNCVKALFA